MKEEELENWSMKAAKRYGKPEGVEDEAVDIGGGSGYECCYCCYCGEVEVEVEAAKTAERAPAWVSCASWPE